MEYNEWEKGCPLLLTQRIILGKWKLSIIWFLDANGTMRYTELKKAFDDSALTQKMLTQHLRELEKDHLIIRKVYDVVPPKVEYRLSEIGESFIPVIRAMENWGKHYINICDNEK